MPQFAFFEPFDGWEQITPSGELEEISEQRFVRLNAEKITPVEVANLKRQKIHLICPICDERQYYNKGFLRQNGDRFHNKIPYFYHSNKEACHFSESLSHALTKRLLFSKLKEAGYEVKEEYRLVIEGRRIRADVAAFTGGKETAYLRLVVEVQASAGSLASLTKKINTYYQEGAPTAWVILLDDFFTGYTGTLNSTLNLENGEYDLQPIEPGEENYFVVTGKDSKIFTLLMNEYGYVLAINNNGHVF